MNKQFRVREELGQACQARFEKKINKTENAEKTNGKTAKNQWSKPLSLHHDATEQISQLSGDACATVE